MKVQSVVVDAACEGEEGLDISISRVEDGLAVECTVLGGTALRVSTKNVRVVFPDGTRIIRAEAK